MAMEGMAVEGMAMEKVKRYKAINWRIYAPTLKLQIDLDKK